MLTENQCIELEKLTNHPKFGILLKNAIEIWKNVADPAIATFGISTIDDLDNKFKLRNPIKRKPCCCLVGAAVIGKNHMNINSDIISEIKYSAAKTYNINEDDIEDLISGFDSGPIGQGSEAHDFGKKVANILFYREDLINQDI